MSGVATDEPDLAIRVQHDAIRAGASVEVGHVPRSPRSDITDIWWLNLIQGVAYPRAVLSGVQAGGCGIQLACAGADGKLNPRNSSYIWKVERSVVGTEPYLTAGEEYPLCCTSNCLGKGRNILFVCDNAVRCQRYACTLDYRQYECPRGTTSKPKSERVEDCTPKWDCLAQDLEVFSNVGILEGQRQVVVHDDLAQGSCPVIAGDVVKLAPATDDTTSGAPRIDFLTFFVNSSSYTAPPKVDVHLLGGADSAYRGRSFSSGLRMTLDGGPQRRLDPLNRAGCTVLSGTPQPTSCFMYNTGSGVKEIGPTATFARTAPKSQTRSGSIVLSSIRDLMPVRVPPLTTAILALNLSGIPPSIHFTGYAQNVKLSAFVSRGSDNQAVFQPAEVLLPTNLLIPDANVSKSEWTLRMYPTSNESLYFRFSIDIIKGNFDKKEYYELFRDLATIHFRPPFRHHVPRASEAEPEQQVDSEGTGRLLTTVNATAASNSTSASPGAVSSATANSGVDGQQNQNASHTFVTVLFREHVSPLRDTSSTALRPTELPANLPRKGANGAVLSFVPQPNSKLTDDPLLTPVSDPTKYWKSYSQSRDCDRSPHRSAAARNVS